MDEQLAQSLAMFTMIANILGLVFYVLQAIGLYLISKKLGDKYPWLAFIPLVQYYTLVKAAGKSGWWILWIFIGYLLLIIPGVVLYIMTLHGISKRCGRGGWTTLGFVFVPFIMFPVVGFKLNEGPISNGSQLQESV